MSIHKFVITGGPCGGKTTALEILKQHFTALGFKVFIIPEAATEIVSLGLYFGEIPVNDFQDFIIKRMIHSENCVENIAKHFDKDVIIFCDRGLLDNKAYMSYDDFIKVLTQNGLDEEKAKNRYDAVFHLVTAANGAENYYTLSNNTVRYESPEEARELDKKTLSAWSTHDNLKIITNSSTFEEKINRLIVEVEEFMINKK